MERRLAARPLNRAWLLALFVLHAVPFISRPALVGGDAVHYALMAHSIASDLDFDLRDDYLEVERGSRAAGAKPAGTPLRRHLREVNGRVVFAHPVGLPVIAAPLVFLHSLIWPGGAPDFLLGSLTLIVTFFALVTVSLLLSELSGQPIVAALAVFGGYFSSHLWFYSRTFITEPYTWAFAVFAVWAIRKSRMGVASFFLALTLAMKETAVLIVAPVVIGAAVLVGWRRAWLLLVGPAAFGVLFMLKNVLTVGTPFATFQPFTTGNIVRGAVGLLIDPVHGLIVFAPLLLVGIVGFLMLSEATIHRTVTLVALSIFISYFAISAMWIDWRGGSSYGPRLLLPALPALMLPLLNVMKRAMNTAWKHGLMSIFLVGFVVNSCAAVDPFTASWGISAFDLVVKNASAALASLSVGLTGWILLSRRAEVASY